MAGAIRARKIGERWQALYFWSKAALLLMEQPKVTSVRFEEGPKAFDDVVVTYHADKAPLDHVGRQILQSHYQCKWHVAAGSISHGDLIDPKAINATSISLLERLRDACRQASDTDRFTLVTTDTISTDDVLQTLVGNTRGEILTNRLFDGTGPTSKMGKVRKAWREALDIGDEELGVLLSQFSIEAGSPNLDRLIETVNLIFNAVGLTPIDTSKSALQYDDICWRWYEQGRRVYSPTSLRTLCEVEGLFEQTVASRACGIRTFVHPIDDIATRTDTLLDLTSHFVGRKIKNPDDWRYQIAPRIRSFLIENARELDRIHLIIDAHVSVAVAAGRSLNVKSGKRLSLEQRTGGRQNLALEPPDSNMLEHECNIAVDVRNGATDVVLEMSITRDVSAGVANDLKKRGLTGASQIRIAPKGSHSQASITGSHHAYAIAQAAIDACANIQVFVGEPITVHLYLAGPNVLAFCLGQLSNVITSLVVYEWDFEQSDQGGYVPGYCC